jgi:sarcosine oxidase subunit beta
MSEKCIVCPCEDVTLADVEQAVSLGYLDIDEVKRFTGLGTGPCQGKLCMVATCQLLADKQAGDAERRQRQPEALNEPHPFTPRPPVVPVSLYVLAAGKGACREH